MPLYIIFRRNGNDPDLIKRKLNPVKFIDTYYRKRRKKLLSESEGDPSIA